MIITNILSLIIGFALGAISGIFIAIIVMADAVYRKRNGLPREDDEFDHI